VVVRALGRRGVPEVELFKSTAELEFNTEDMTYPQLVQGSSDPQHLGVAVMTLSEEGERDVVASVLESDAFNATQITYPALAPNAVTQLSFLLEPKASLAEADATLPVTLRLDGGTVTWTYETEIEIGTVAPDASYRRTRRSNVDGSTQYYGVLPPSGTEPSDGYGLILSLHGASVEAAGQATSYSPKDWAYLVAATNRRPFGFDWEEWGRIDALETFDDAIASFSIDTTRTHLTGHSMGGHGTWHVGVHYSGLFGVIAPSAGWISFETYGGSEHPDDPIGSARAHSETLEYVDNLAPKTVYIIHGDADDNVPVWHGRTMFDTLDPIVADLTYHEQPGARHWWDLDPDEAGADCVDWEPMIDVMEATYRDPTPIEFVIRRPSPWINPTHAYVTVLSAVSPLQDYVLESVAAGGEVELTTTNVRAFEIDTAKVISGGGTSLTVNGEAVALDGNTASFGPDTGKRFDRQGPLNQVWHKPFCFVWDDDAPRAYRDYAAYMLSFWSVIGNGHGCGVALSNLTDTIRDSNNLIYLGVPMSKLDGAGALPIEWDDDGAVVSGQAFGAASVAFVYPEGDDRLNGYFSVAEGKEYLLFRYVPFSSRSGMPDFLVWADTGLAATGFFTADWEVSTSYASGLD